VAGETDRTVRESIIDRLIDHDVHTGADPSATWGDSVARTKRALLRDLDWLLNTRRTVEIPPPSCPEVLRSVYAFGLLDISSLSADAESTRQILVREIEECIRVFEPRLTQVRVSTVETEVGEQRQLRFVIEGLLRMEPNPVRVLFDTVLELSSGKIMVGEGLDA
jgi:type VI secretion system protein ImpF